MATGIGYLTICGAAKEGTYRTSVAANNRLPLLGGESITDTVEHLASEALEGKSGLRAYDLGMKTIAGSIPLDLVYDQKVTGTSDKFVGIGLPLAIAMGTCAWGSVGSVNVLSLIESPTVPMTLAFLQRTDSVREASSCFAKSFKISGKAGEPAKLELDFIAYNLLRGAALTNTAAVLNALPTVTAPRCLFSDMTFKIATDFADVLAAADQIAISDFTLSYNAGMSDSQFATIENTGHTAANLTLQPVRAGFRTLDLEFTLPRHTVDTYAAAFVAGTPYQAQITFTSGSNTIKIYLPYLIIEAPTAPTASAGIIEEKIKMRALRGDDYNAGAGNVVMLLADGETAVTEEIVIELKNERTAAIW